MSDNEYEGGDEKDVKKQGHPDYLVCDGKVWSPNSHNLAEKRPEQSHEPILISYEIQVSKMTRNPWYGRDGLKFKKALLSEPELVPYPFPRNFYFHFQEEVVKRYEYVLISFIVEESGDGI